MSKLYRRFAILFLCLLLNGSFMGWGTPAHALVLCSGIMALAGMAIMLSFRDDRTAQILFALLSLTPVVGFWLGFLLHRVLS